MFDYKICCKNNHLFGFHFFLVQIPLNDVPKAATSEIFAKILFFFEITRFYGGKFGGEG